MVRGPIRPEAFLARLQLFHALPPEDIARLAAGTSRRALRRGETLFLQGERSSGLHAVVYGRVKLTQREDEGRVRVVDIVGPGRTFGEPILFLEKPYIVDAVAVVDSLVLHVARETVFAELESNPRFAKAIIGALAERVESLVHELRDRTLGSGRLRFVGWLLRQPAVPGSDDPDVVMLPVTKRLLASRLGLSAEHLSRIFGELSAAGLIGVRGRAITIHDRARLRATLPTAPRSP